MRNRWSSNYSKRSVKRWHRLPTIEVRTYVSHASVGPASISVRSNVPSTKTFTGLTMAHANRRADRWLSNR